MKIGLPRALLFYRYGVLWTRFFRALGCEVVLSEETGKDILAAGTKNALDETCLPVKIFMGHVAALAGRCDFIFVPRFSKCGKDAEFCDRLWGLPDMVANVFREIPLISYSLEKEWPAGEAAEFVKMGRKLGKGAALCLRAYQAGRRRQYALDEEKNCLPAAPFLKDPTSPFENTAQNQNQYLSNILYYLSIDLLVRQVYNEINKTETEVVFMMDKAS